VPGPDFDPFEFAFGRKRGDRDFDNESREIREAAREAAREASRAAREAAREATREAGRAARDAAREMRDRAREMQDRERAFGMSDSEREREAAREAAREGRRRRRDTENLESEDRGPARYLCIRVTEPGNSRPTVNLQLPLGLVNFGLKVAGRYIPEKSGIQMQAISEAIQRGAIGKILDIQDGKDDDPGSRVEISVE
jgi:hypothetical protein